MRHRGNDRVRELQFSIQPKSRAHHVVDANTNENEGQDLRQGRERNTCRDHDLAHQKGRERFELNLSEGRRTSVLD